MDSLTHVAEIIVPRPIDKPLTYLVPENLLSTVRRGSVVRVPFRNKTIESLVLNVRPKTDLDDNEYKLKSVDEAVYPEPLFSEDDVLFLSRVADYYQLPLGEVFHSALPKEICNFPKRATKKKEKPELPLPHWPLLNLTADQGAALDAILPTIEKKISASFLLHGVTGSGKTEVYLECCRRALALGRTTLVLVPEISLTPQLRARFEERFGDLVAVLHSSLGPAPRRETWWSIFRGEKRVVLGARSALFAPIRDLGLVIVDEEHEPSYKQEDRLRYQARDLALLLARQRKVPIVLGSATPAIETYFAAQNGRHKLLELRERPNARPMPEFEIIDLKAGPKTSAFLTEPLIDALSATLSRGEQAMLFINRKGFSNFLLCKDCGEVRKCLNCAVSLTFYRSRHEARCHYCTYAVSASEKCASCGSPDVQFMGAGTERVEEELKFRFPNIATERFDSETMTTPKKLEECLARFRSGETKVLVGTQMLAKGHDFPNVTLVGVVLADLSLHFPDFRAGERTFQLIAQVAGRAGRAEKPGKVLLQTFLPDHYVIQTASKHDFQAFYAAELEERRMLKFPPFTKLAQIEFRDLKDDRARGEAEKIRVILDSLSAQIANGPDGEAFSYLGPAPAAIPKIANQYRWKILMKSEKISLLNSVIKTLRRAGLRLVDVDPVNTL